MEIVTLNMEENEKMYYNESVFNQQIFNQAYYGLRTGAGTMPWDKKIWTLFSFKLGLTLQLALHFIHLKNVYLRTPGPSVIIVSEAANQDTGLSCFLKQN